MNGKSSIDRILNPGSHEADKHTYGIPGFNFKMVGKTRWVCLNIGPFTFDFYPSETATFTAWGGGAKGFRYWMLFHRYGMFRVVFWGWRIRDNATAQRGFVDADGCDTSGGKL